MGNIKFSVHRNPKKDTEGNDTYQVRHETTQTVGKEYLINHLRGYNAPQADALEMGIHALQRLVVEQLTGNNRVHIEGFGSFYLTLGFREHDNEDGTKIKPLNQWDRSLIVNQWDRSLIDLKINDLSL